MSQFNFPRTELAKKIITSFDNGLSSSIAFNAPRRKGKTQFLLNDIPVAADGKYFIVYTSLWQNLNNPVKGLIADLQRSLESLSSKPAKLMKSFFKDKSIEGQVKSDIGSFKIRLASNPVKASNQELDEVSVLIQQISQKSKLPVILVIDEIQHLATSKVFWPIASALRTALDRMNGKVKSIFTGSSRSHMRLLAKDKKSQFYNFSSEVDFPDLDVEFLKFLVAGVKSAFGLKLSIAQLKIAFDDFDKSPYWIRRLIEKFALGEGSFDEIYSNLLEVIVEEGDLSELTDKLSIADRIVYLEIYKGRSPFSQAVRDLIEQMSDVQGTDSSIQSSLRKLIKRHVISLYERGSYLNEEVGLGRYLINEYPELELK